MIITPAGGLGEGSGEGLGEGLGESGMLINESSECLGKDLGGDLEWSGMVIAMSLCL